MFEKKKLALAALAGLALTGASSVCSAGAVTASSSGRPNQITNPALDISFGSVQLIVDIDETNHVGTLTLTGKEIDSGMVQNTTRVTILTAHLTNVNPADSTLATIDSASINLAAWSTDPSITTTLSNPVTGWGFTTNTGTTGGATFLLTGMVNGVRDNISIAFNLTANTLYSGTTGTTLWNSASPYGYEADAHSANTETLDLRVVPTTPTPNAAAGASALGAAALLRRRRVSR